MPDIDDVVRFGETNLNNDTQIMGQQIPSSDTETETGMPILEREKKNADSSQTNRKETVLGAASATSASWYQGRPWLRCIPLYLIFLVYLLFFWAGARELGVRRKFELDDRVTKVQIKIQKKNSITIAPWSIPTGLCSIRVVNTCTNRPDCTLNRIIGDGLESIQKLQIDQDTTVHQFTVSPVITWSSLPETFQNRKICDVLVILDRTKSLEIIAENVKVFAENVALRSIIIDNSQAIGELWFQSKNLTVSHKLNIQGANAGILIDGLSMPSSASASIAVREGIVDLTTSSHPSFSISSVNQAACLVGALPSPPAESTISADGNTTATLYVGSFACPSIYPCSQPHLTISTLGPMSSIGVHASGLAAPSLGRVHSGAAFRNGVFAAVDTGLAKGADDWAYVRLRGLGLMQGGLQLIRSLRSIWLFFESDVTYFAWHSAFVVMPRMVERDITVSFCPAHGPGVEKQLTLPLKQIMSDVPGEASWAYRNYGSLRDSMLPLDVAAGINGYGTYEISYDRFVPDCAYCAHTNLWRSSYYVGSFGRLTGTCEGFPDPEGCKTYTCFKKSAHTFALVPNGAAPCYPAAAVEALTSNEGVRFNESLGSCWTSADVKCAALPGGGNVDSVYANSQASTLMLISWAIGSVSSIYFLRTVYAVVVRGARCEIIASALLTEPRALMLVHAVVLLSHRFAAIRAAPQPSPRLPVAADEECLIGGEPGEAAELGFVALDRMDVRLGVRASIQRWLRTLGILAWEEELGEGSGLTAVRARDLASRRFVRRLQQVCDISFDSDGHLVLGPDGLRPLGGPLPAAPGEAWRVIWIDDGGAAREWADRVPGAEGAIGATVGERFCELQATARHVKYMLQRMQVDVSIWFLLERPMEHRSLPPPPPPAVEAVAAVAAAENGRLPMPPYWQLARALRAETAHTWLGATQALAAHVVFVLSEPMAMLYFCSTFYYARMKDRGVTDLGVGGTTQIVEDLLGLTTTLLVVVINSVSATMHYCRTYDWGQPPIPPPHTQARAAFHKVVPGPSDVGDGLSTECVKKPSLPADDETDELWAQHYRKADWWYATQMLGRDLMLFIWAFSLGMLVFYGTVVAVWVLLGMFIEPNAVAPYATAVASLVAHVWTLYKGLAGFRDDARLRLSAAIRHFREGRRDEARALLRALGPDAVEAGNELVDAAAGASASQTRWGAPSEDAQGDALQSQCVGDAGGSGTDPGSSEGGAKVRDTINLSGVKNNAAGSKDKLFASRGEGGVKGGFGEAGSGSGGGSGARVSTESMSESLGGGGEVRGMGRDVAALRETALSGVEDPPDHEVEAWLARFGVTAQGVILSALTSGLLLCLILLFLFIGMQVFADKIPDAIRATTNSFLVALAGIATNVTARIDGERPLRKLVGDIMDSFVKQEAETRLSFSLDEDVGSLFGRAAGMQTSK